MVDEALDLPPVEQLRPGIWCIPVPLPIAWLRYVLVYLFETDEGPYLVDAGWNTDDAFAALNAGLEQVGTEMAAVQGVLVTHLHLDHYGLAGRIRESSGAWVGLNPVDAALIHDRYIEPAPMNARIEETLLRGGLSEAEVEAMRGSNAPARSVSPESLRPDILIEDGDRPKVPGWDLHAIWTPGHSPGHLCFIEERNRLILSGDHVLPRITPNIALHPQASANPLGDYLSSLAKVDAYEVDEVLPAHEYRFSDLHGRVGEIVHHHEQRLAEVVVAVEAGYESALDIASQMTWSRPWERIRRRARRAAVLEALAHLRYLEQKGELREIVGIPSRWLPTSAHATR